MHSRVLSGAIGSNNFGYRDRTPADTGRIGGFVFNAGYRDSVVDSYQDNRNVGCSDGAGTNQNNGYQDSGICGRFTGFKINNRQDGVGCAKPGYYRDGRESTTNTKSDYQDSSTMFGAKTEKKRGRDSGYQRCGVPLQADYKDNRDVGNNRNSYRKEDGGSNVGTENGCRGSGADQDIGKNQPDGVAMDCDEDADARSDITPADTSIDCFIGNQQQLLNENLLQPGEDAPAHEDGMDPQPSPVESAATTDSENDLEQASGFLFF